MLAGHSAPWNDTLSRLDSLTSYSSEGGVLAGHLAPWNDTPSRSDLLTSYNSEGGQC